ncbi:putative vacuolar protein sorting-associated protein 9A-like [Capsicum annuum]|nr:putative vacuolar protein sorting-associated protein 9A-like [Capsicum annuum]
MSMVSDRHESILKAAAKNEALAVSIEPHKKKVEGGNGKVILASSMVGGFVGVTAIIDLAFVVFRKEYTKKKARYLSETRKLGLLGVPPYRTFVLDELREATNNFDISNLIGESSSGQIYKGKLTDGVVVAIRNIKMRMISKFNSKVNMDTTMSAAIGIAKGIQLLHTGIVPGIFSNQLKITDVLLDQNFHDSGPSSNGSKRNNELR